MKVDDSPSGCPRCGTPLVIEPTMPTWCEACDWGLPVAPATSGNSWWERGVQVVLTRARARTFTRLRTDPTSLAAAPSRRLAGVLATVILAGGAVLLAALVVLALTRPGWWRLPALAGVAAVGWVLVPRPGGLPASAEPLDPAETPATHAFVAQVAAAVGARPPDRIAVDTLGMPRGRMAAQVAARNSADPWTAIETAERPTAREVERRRRIDARNPTAVDATHPRTQDRLALLEAVAPRPAPAPPLEMAEADRELRALRSPLTRRLVEELIHDVT